MATTDTPFGRTKLALALGAGLAALGAVAGAAIAHGGGDPLATGILGGAGGGFALGYVMAQPRAGAGGFALLLAGIGGFATMKSYPSGDPRNLIGPVGGFLLAIVLTVVFQSLTDRTAPVASDPSQPWRPPEPGVVPPLGRRPAGPPAEDPSRAE